MFVVPYSSTVLIHLTSHAFYELFALVLSVSYILSYFIFSLDYLLPNTMCHRFGDSFRGDQ